MTTRLYGDVLPDNDQTRARQEHFRGILALVGNPYPNRFERSRVTKSDEGEDTISSITAEFKKHEPKPEPGARPTPEQLDAACAELPQASVRISGRLATPPRVMGKAAFVHLSDGRERLQIYVRKQEAVAVSNDSLKPVEEPESGWKLFQLLDHGDFVGVEGKLFVTKTGELSVHVETIQFLSKALLPMPDKLHGINDPEIRQRQRYADLIASSLKVRADEDGDSQPELSTREVFERRSKLISAMRRHLDEHGYIEVETPMLSPIASGAAARPFTTHHKALDIDLYLRIAPELYLKRLLVGGFERVYELNRNFRNEGISTRHNPEFTMLEFYTAYKDVNWMMDFCEDMLQKAEQVLIDSLSSEEKERYTPKLITNERWPRLSMKEAIAKIWMAQDDPERQLTAEMLDDPRVVYALEQNILGKGKLPYFWGIEKAGITQDDVIRGMIVSQSTKKEAEELIIPEEELGPEETGKRIQNIFELLEKHPNAYFHGFFRRMVEHPVFIIDHPKVVSPLSKASPDNPTIAERFELYVAGMEVANGFSELNDPAEQLERFEEQTRQREGGDEEAMQTDLDYVRALSYGMPPAAGIGIGVDRLTMLLTNRRSIRDVILFPHMRPRHTAEAQAEEEPPAEPASDS